MVYQVPSVRFSLAVYKAILFFHIPVLFSLRRADLCRFSTAWHIQLSDFLTNRVFYELHFSI